MPKTFRYALLCASIAAFFSACGGGGSQDDRYLNRDRSFSNFKQVGEDRSRQEEADASEARSQSVRQGSTDVAYWNSDRLNSSNANDTFYSPDSVASLRGPARNSSRSSSSSSFSSGDNAIQTSLLALTLGSLLPEVGKMTGGLIGADTKVSHTDTSTSKKGTESQSSPKSVLKNETKSDDPSAKNDCITNSAVVSDQENDELNAIFYSAQRGLRD